MGSSGCFCSYCSHKLRPFHRLVHSVSPHHYEEAKKRHGHHQVKGPCPAVPVSDPAHNGPFNYRANATKTWKRKGILNVKALITCAIKQRVIKSNIKAL